MLLISINNLIKIAANCSLKPVIIDSINAQGNPAFKFEWDLSGFLQHLACWNLKNKLELAPHCPDFQSILNVEVLENTKHQSVLDGFFEVNRETASIFAIKETLEKENMRIQPSEVHLNQQGSHVLIDSFQFEKSGKFKYIRKLLGQYMVTQTEHVGT
jgi:hypothetical protein